MKFQSPLDRAKNTLTIPDVWQLLGLPGVPRKSCKSPFRNDRNPSFSVFVDGKFWRDFGTGQRGDVVSFVAEAKSCSLSDAAKWLIMQADTKGSYQTKPLRRLQAASAQPHKLPKFKLQLLIPDFSKGTYTEVIKLQKLRKLPLSAGIEILLNRGLLGFCTINGHRCWLVTDSQRLNAQARKLDGSTWQRIGGVKAYTLPGSKAGRIIGIQESARFSFVWIVEGTPDLLAAATMAFMQDKVSNVGFLCITGAGNRINAEDLPGFKRKIVTVFAHNDNSGYEAAQRWARQIQPVANSVEILISDKSGEDLNDVVSRGDFEQETEPDVCQQSDSNLRESQCH